MVLYICGVTTAALELHYSVYTDRHTECINLPWAKVVYPQHKDAFTYRGHDNVWATERVCAQVWHSKQSLTASKRRSIEADIPLENIVKFCPTPSCIPPPFSSLLHLTQCLHKSPKHKAVSSSSGIYQTWFCVFWTAYIMHQHKG